MSVSVLLVVLSQRDHEPTPPSLAPTARTPLPVPSVSVTSDPTATDDDPSAPAMSDAEAEQASAAAQAAALAIATQPAGETGDARAARLGLTFAAESPALTLAPVIDVPGATDLTVTATRVQWVQMGEAVTGRLPAVVSVEAVTTWIYDGVAWQDTSSQVWQIDLVRDQAGVWLASLAAPLGD